MKISIILFVALLSALVIHSILDFDSASKAENVKNIKANNASTSVQYDVVDYGSGVYYFPYIKSSFGNALSSFIEKNPKLKLVCFSGNGDGVNGSVSGYFAVFKTE